MHAFEINHKCLEPNLAVNKAISCHIMLFHAQKGLAPVAQMYIAGEAIPVYRSVSSRPFSVIDCLCLRKNWNLKTRMGGGPMVQVHYL